MRKFIATIIATFTLFGGMVLTAGEADAHRDVPRKARACKYEDAPKGNCVWDARHRGNGIGRSFYVDKRGKQTFITHRKAHRMVKAWRNSARYEVHRNWQYGAIVTPYVPEWEQNDPQPFTGDDWQQ